MQDSTIGQGFAGAGQFVITGAYGGIGSTLARALHARGAQLMLTGRDDARGQALADELGAKWASCDVTDPEALVSTFEAAKSDGAVAGVAHCVGSILLKPAHLTSPEEFRETCALNLDSAFYIVRAAGKVLRKDCSVVLCSSAAASTGLVNHDAIAAAKGGLEALTRSAGASYASRGLRVNAVAPGLVDTPLAAAITQNERAVEASARMHPVGRIGQAEDVVRAMLFLLDPANTWCTGEVLHVDGGLSRLRPAQRG